MTRSTAVNQLKTLVLLGALSALLLLIGAAVSPTALWLFGLLAVAMNIGAYFWSDKLVLRMNRAHPLGPGEDPELESIVAELTDRAGLPRPRLYLIDDPAPNAFATGRDPRHSAVAVTSGIRQLLSPRELRGVLSHELSHVSNRDILIASVAATVASVIAMVAYAVRWGALFGGLGGGRDRDRGGGLLGALAVAIVAPIAATIIQLAISRAREYGADESGARLSGDPLALASALHKLERGNHDAARVGSQLGTSPTSASLFIVAPLSGRQVASWFSTHPPLAERIRRLEAMAHEHGGD